MTSSGALLQLLIFAFISAVVPLNPDDPNVCSHWERSVPPPQVSDGEIAAVRSLARRGKLMESSAANQG